jgi:myo-inositol-1(or 4)-monophosphatase
MVTGFPYDRGRPLDVQLAVLAEFLRAPVHGIRRDGSAAVDCCHVASGRCDGFWEYGLKVWDVAAGAIICREAGAVVSDVDGEPWGTASSSICVANPTLHTQMLEVIERANPRL